MQDNFMEYPESYYKHIWAGKIKAIIRFTPKRTSFGGYEADLDKPYDIIWSYDQKTKEFFERSKKIVQFSKSSMYTSKSNFIISIFENDKKGSL